MKIDKPEVQPLRKLKKNDSDSKNNFANEAVKAKTMKEPVIFQVKINKSFDSFNQKDQLEFVKGVCSFLNINESELRIKGKQRGCTQITFEISEENAKLILENIQKGHFHVLDVIDGKILSKEEAELYNNAIDKDKKKISIASQPQSFYADKTLYIFSPSKEERRYQLQMETLSDRLLELCDHGVTIAEVFEHENGRLGGDNLPSEGCQGLRQEHHIMPGQFKVVLVTDSSIKLNAESCISCEEIIMSLESEGAERKSPTTKRKS